MAFPSQAALVAQAHQAALAMLSRAARAPRQRFLQGAWRMRIGVRWSRKRPALDDALAICRHIEEQSSAVYLAE